MKPYPQATQRTRLAAGLPRILVALSVLGAVATSGADPARRTFTIAPLPQLLGQVSIPVPPGTAPTAQATRAVAPDPTRPPAGLASPGRANTAATASTGVAPAPAATPLYAPSTAPAIAAEKPRVQALQVPSSGEPSAMVDGQILKIGDRLGDLTVADIGADGIVMKGPRGKEHWPLIPNDKRRTPQRVASPPEQDPAPKGAPATTVAGRKEH